VRVALSSCGTCDAHAAGPEGGALSAQHIRPCVSSRGPLAGPSLRASTRGVPPHPWRYRPWT
jgi:hypothetical protein